MSTGDVTVVTVTYGKRWQMLRKVLAAVLNQGVPYAVVVDNASQDPVSQLAAKEFGGNVRVVTMPHNTGSAKGFKTGIEHALTLGTEFIWLLDDDNHPMPTALVSLAKAYAEAEKNFSVEKLALLSFRHDHQADIAAGVPLHRCYPRTGSFLGFHMFDIPYKVWHRTPWGKPSRRGAFPDLIPVPFAPYSGLFFQRSVVDFVGYPDTDMVLYADDTEFTSRLTRLGGHIFLVPDSRIHSLESSWNSKANYSSSFSAWLRGPGDTRAYYAARNQSFIESTDRPSPMRAANKWVYLSLLTAVAISGNHFPRLQLLLHAVREGEAGRLGMDGRFPL